MKDLLLTSKYSLNLDNFWLLTHERKECNMEIKESILSRKTDLSLGRSYTVFFLLKLMPYLKLTYLLMPYVTFHINNDSIYRKII